MAPPSKVQRKTLSVEEKIRLLDLAKENSNKISDLLSQFTIGLSTFYKIKAQETALRDAKENSNKISDLLSQFTIGLSTFYKTKAQETALRDASIANKNLKRKRSKASKHDDLSQALM
uniref:Transposase n=1 Tax=Plectus sambesii TaxID=2011161 RepID=A0A914X6J2_9BILA